MKRRVIPLYGKAKRNETRFGGAAIGFLVGATPAFLPAIFVAKAWGPIAAAVASLAILLPIMWGGIKVFGMLQPELRIGADGISLKGGSTSATRFVRFEQLEKIEVTSYTFNRKESIGLKVTYGGKSDVLGDIDSVQEAEAVVKEILDTKARWEQERSPVVGLATLDNAGAPVGAWIEALRSRAKNDADYRNAALGRDQLLELIENGTATAEHRVGAAVLLAAKEGGPARERIRIAAETTANPKLRVALTAIADDAVEEEAIEEALREERATLRR
jgi:hypothetical protein